MDNAHFVDSKYVAALVALRPAVRVTLDQRQLSLM